MDKDFEWDEIKNKKNKVKHGILFEDAQYAFKDKRRIIIEDNDHSYSEKRYYCIGRTGNAVATIRFTYRNNKIRIIGAGYWRKGRRRYEKKYKIYR